WRRTRDRTRRHGAVLTALLLVLSSAVLAVLLQIARLRSEAREAENESKLEKQRRELETERADRAEKARLEEARRLFTQNVRAARAAAARGDWEAAWQSYGAATEGLPAGDPDRLSLEVEALPAWFLYRSRQQVAAELDRLDGFANLKASDRAKV